MKIYLTVDFFYFYFQSHLGSVQNPLLKNRLKNGLNTVGKGIKQGAIKTGHGLVKLGKGVKKTTKKTERIPLSLVDPRELCPVTQFFSLRERHS